MQEQLRNAREDITELIDDQHSALCSVINSLNAIPQSSSDLFDDITDLKNDLINVFISTQKLECENDKWKIKKGFPFKI